MTQNVGLVVRPTAAAGHSVDLDVPIDNPDSSGLDLIIDITDEDTGGGAGAMVVTIQGVDANGKLYTILASASLATVALTVLRVGRGLTAAANAVANSHVPKKINININHTNGNPMVYSIGLNLIR